MKEFLVRKIKTFAFIKTMCRSSAQPRSDFQLNYISGFGNRFYLVGQLFADAHIAYRFIDVQFLDLADFPTVVHQILNVEAQKSDGLLIDRSKQINNIWMLDIFKIKRMLRRFIHHFIFKQIDESIHRFEIGRGGKTDDCRIQWNCF
jgi:hypothetical protein